jgi:hypothetical protein
LRPSEGQGRGPDFDIRGPSAQKSTGNAVFAAKKTQPVRRDAGHASKFWNYGNFDDNTIN